MLSSLPFQVNLWKVQNLCFEIQQVMTVGAARRAKTLPRCGPNSFMPWPNDLEFEF
jgi:hypothetical protein